MMMMNDSPHPDVNGLFHGTGCVRAQVCLDWTVLEEADCNMIPITPQEKHYFVSCQALSK